MGGEDHPLIQRLEALLQAWDAAVTARDKPAIDRLSAEIETLMNNSELIEELRRTPIAVDER